MGDEGAGRLNAVELFHQDGRPANVFYCGKCRTVSTGRNHAEQCCQNYLCTKCGGETGGRAWLVCEPCRRAQDEAREAQRFEQAEKVTEWSGPVYVNDHYYRNLEEYFDYANEEGWDARYVWTCDEVHFVKACISDITGNMEGEAYEDWDPETLNGLEDLKAALDKFNEANVGQVSWTPNYNRALLLPTGGSNQ